MSFGQRADWASRREGEGEESNMGAFLWLRSYSLVPLIHHDPTHPSDLRVRSFAKIQIRIFSLPRVDSSVPLMHHDPSDFGSKIRIWIFRNERTLRSKIWIRIFPKKHTISLSAKGIAG